MRFSPPETGSANQVTPFWEVNAQIAGFLLKSKKIVSRCEKATFIR